MAFPAFFAQPPRIALHDPLARLLGASDDGLIEYGYEDAVRLAGHSCPTVAGAWLMTVRALRALYPDTPPQRGDIDVTFADDPTSGAPAASANVGGLDTGATTDTSTAAARAASPSLKCLRSITRSKSSPPMQGSSTKYTCPGSSNTSLSEAMLG